MTGAFPSVTKTGKVVPVFKKDSKLDYSNHSPISLLSNIGKSFEKLMYKRLHTFLNKNNVIYNLYTVWIQTTVFYISCFNYIT